MARTKKIVSIYLDPVANTLNIWWDDPKKAYSAEEVVSSTSNDVIIKDREGRPISLEVIGIFPRELNIVDQLKKTTKISNKEPFLLEVSNP